MKFIFETLFFKKIQHNKKSFSSFDIIFNYVGFVAFFWRAKVCNVHITGGSAPGLNMNFMWKN